jgi:hypothetical protein
MISTPKLDSKKPKNVKVLVLDELLIICSISITIYTKQKSEFSSILSLKYFAS